ncbi:MAG: transcription/translation regulatory transformer protein RfaH, partial [Quisquiliibacterium sp.]
LFIRLDSSDQGPSWSPIRSTLGVTGLVRFGTNAAWVDDGLIDLLRAREAQAPTQAMFAPGDAVIVRRGPFAGIEAIYQTADAQHRAMILLEILGKKVTMTVPAGELKKRATP